MGGTSELVTFANTSATSYTTLLPEMEESDNETFYFVFAANDAVRSRLSVFRTIPQLERSIPSVPNNLRVLFITSSTVTLLWNHPFGEARVNVSSYKQTSICQITPMYFLYKC